MKDTNNIYQVWCDHNIYPCDFKETDVDYQLFAPEVGVHVNVNKRALKILNDESFELGGHQFVIIK